MYKRIKELRLEKNLTVSELANLLGCCEQTYKNYETGKSRILIGVLIKIADFYDVSVDYLVKHSHKRNRK